MQQRIAQFTAIIALSSAAMLAVTLPVHAQNLAAVPATQATISETATPAQDHVLNIRQVYDKLEAAGYTDIREIDREFNGYEVKARNREGSKVKLYVDPRSGEVIRTKMRDDD